MMYLGFLIYYSFVSNCKGVFNYFKRMTWPPPLPPLTITQKKVQRAKHGFIMSANLSYLFSFLSSFFSSSNISGVKALPLKIRNYAWFTFLSLCSQEGVSVNSRLSNLKCQINAPLHNPWTLFGPLPLAY